MTSPDPDRANERRDALHARVRRLCGERKVLRIAMFESENLAFIEFEKEAVILTIEGGRFREVRITNRQGSALAKLLVEIYE